MFSLVCLFGTTSQTVVVYSARSIHGWHAYRIDVAVSTPGLRGQICLFFFLGSMDPVSCVSRDLLGIMVMETSQICRWYWMVAYRKYDWTIARWNSMEVINCCWSNPHFCLLNQHFCCLDGVRSIYIADFADQQEYHVDPCCLFGYNEFLCISGSSNKQCSFPHGRDGQRSKCPLDKLKWLTSKITRVM